MTDIEMIAMLKELYSMGQWTEYDELFEEMRMKGMFINASKVGTYV